MSVTLRIILILVSVGTCTWMLRRIRSAQVKIEDSVFWFVFSALLVIMGVFPEIMTFGAAILGVQAPVNFVFLLIIFVLIAKLFQMSVRISQLESKIQSLAQRYSLDNMQNEGNDGNR